MASDHLPGRRVVAFLDILGFRKMVEQMPQDPSLFVVVAHLLGRERDRYELWRDIRGRVSKSELPPGIRRWDRLEGTLFSDTVVYSMPTDGVDLREAVLMVIAEVKHNTRKLMRAGVFVRGGIAVGWTYHHDGIVFGQGMNAAYDLESRVARIPRVVLGDGIVELVDSRRPRLLRRDSDGVWYLNLFTSDLPWDLPSDYLDTEWRHVVESHIRKGLAENSGRVGIVAKYRWLAGRYNECLEDPYEHLDPNWIAEHRIPLD
jgi:hypothetical protein